MSRAYYNEIDPYAAQWLRNLIAAGHIAPGDVDERSILDVRPDDLKGYTQCHFFAGIGGWSLAARLAGFPDDRELWTGSCPCQPFSVAGAQKGQDDERHLWPVFFGLVAARRPAVVMGEQVAAAVGKHWLDGVSADLEGIGYACGAVVVPACAVDAPHRRDRLWFVADADAPSVRGRRPEEDVGAPRTGEGQRAERQRVRPDAGDVGDSRNGALADAGQVGRDGWASHAGRKAWADARTEDSGALADAGCGRRGQPGEGQAELARRAEAVGTGDGDVADADQSGPQGRVVLRERSGQRSAWSDGVGWAIGADGKARRVKSGLRLLAHGVPARVGKLRAYGNAIVPQVAAEVIAAYLEA